MQDAQRSIDIGLNKQIRIEELNLNMNFRILAVLIFLSLTFANCGTDILDSNPTKTNAQDNLQLNTPSSSKSSQHYAASTNHYIVEESIDGAAFVPCARNGDGETVRFFGDRRVIIQETINGNHQLYSSHSSMKNLVGIGLSTGTVYEGRGLANEVSNDWSDGIKLEFTLVSWYRFVLIGPRNNVVIKEISHVAIDADGIVKSEVEKYSAECR